MNEVQTTHNALMQWDAEKIKLLRDTICKGADDNEFSLAMQVVQRTGLDPFAGQIHFIKRWNSQLGREEMKPQVGIDGFRLIAQRSGKYAGQLGPNWCGKDGAWRDVWLDNEPPAACRVGVLHQDFKEPLWSVARFSTYLQTKKDGMPKGLWQKGGDLMIAKCAEALALRKAFPQELSGLYTADEMGAMDEKDITPHKPELATEQAAWEAEKGIAQKPAEPEAPPQPTPDELAQKAIAAQRKKRFDSLPDDIKDYFRALKLSYGKIFEILDANQNEPVAVRAYMAENPIQPQGDTLAEKLAGEGMAAAG